MRVVVLAGRVAFRVGPMLHQVPEDAGRSEAEHGDHMDHGSLLAAQSGEKYTVKRCC